MACPERYQPNSFTVHGDVDGHSTNFREVVANWERKGLVIKSKLVIGALNEESMKFHEFCSHERYDAQGGLLELLQQEVRELERTRQVEVQRCQLSGMTFSEEKQEWTLTDLQGSTYGPYNTVLLAFDSLPRAARKASMKQLLESALPYTVDVIGAVGRSVTASAMAVVVEFNPPVDPGFDGVAVEGRGSTLAWAGRNPVGAQLHRGRELEGSGDTWTLVATPQWTKKIRPNHKRGWDKIKTGKQLVEAFGNVIGIPNLECKHQVRFVVPTFHWMGASPLTTTKTGHFCLLDSNVNLGWCGDIFARPGPEGAMLSGRKLGELVSYLDCGLDLPTRDMLLPGDSGWAFREKGCLEESDVAAITGRDCGREILPAQIGIDDTWTLAADLATGVYTDDIPTKVDSLSTYRRRGVWEKDLGRKCHSQGFKGNGSRIGQRKGGRGGYNGEKQGGKGGRGSYSMDRQAGKGGKGRKGGRYFADSRLAVY